MRAQGAAMSPDVFLVVLAAAALHAGWNTLLKLRAHPAAAPVDPMVATLLLGMAACLISVLLLPFNGLPAPAAWPYALASAVIHIAYYLLVGAAYRASDLSAAYPITRGTAPMGSALLAAFLIGEALSPRPGSASPASAPAWWGWLPPPCAAAASPGLGSVSPAPMPASSCSTRWWTGRAPAFRATPSATRC